jgi:hypothetical protein
MTAGPAFRPIAEPLRLAALEVADLARLGDRLQGVIASLSANRSGRPDPGLVIEAQAADLMSQRLMGLAAFLTALAEAAPADTSIDIYEAVMDLTLAEQARRLGGPSLAPAGPVAPADGGDLVLFGD